MAFATIARGLIQVAGRVLVNKYTAAAAAGALAITAGPVFVERGVRGIAAGNDAHKFARTTYEDLKKLSLKDSSSYKPIR